jgi:hypothetical protein
VRLNRRRVGRRNRRVTVRLPSVRPLGAPTRFIRLTAHIVVSLVVSLRDDTPMTGKMKK